MAEKHDSYSYRGAPPEMACLLSAELIEFPQNLLPLLQPVEGQPLVHECDAY